MMKLRTSERKNAKIRMALQAPSGGGKTHSAILLAKGLTGGDLTKVAIVDTENGSADLYSHLGKYNVLTLQQPFTPEQYIDAIKLCEDEGMEVIILDSVSHSWEELLDFHSKLSGNSFTNWAKVTPRQKAFVDAILQSKAHVIATMRTKQDYVLNQKDGKFVPEKVGLKSVQRDGLDYEMTIVFDIDIKHFVTCSKDRTNLFMGKPTFVITEETGKLILDWCYQGDKDAKIELFKEKISKCKSQDELKDLFKNSPEFQQSLRPEFLQKLSYLKPNFSTQNLSLNGSSING